ncbi:MAG: hypothetical protein JWO38_5360 [Gemmataceae bacterium]|nr:hypothetical protein [Gemmataceae bacterium]
MKRWLKRAAFALAPETATAVLSARSHRLVRDWGLWDLNRKLIAHLGPAVQAGPFQGLVLSPMTYEEHLGPFLLGTYEAELHPWLVAVIGGRFSRILDVGAKFGYYAVGLARRMPGTPVLAFDTDWWARAATREMATANRTPSVSVAGFCSPRWLDRYLTAGSFILTDCEGYEGELFRRASTPALDTATLLVESHDNLSPEVGMVVRQRFARTHDLAVVTSVSRTAPPGGLGFLTPAEAETAANEVRDPQEWLLFTPKSS